MRKPRQKMSSIHRALCRLLRECGISCDTEIPKGPYQIDCFSAQLNLAFEADGPCHGTRHEKDRRRDHYLWKHFGIPVLRLNARQLRNPVLAKIEIHQFVRERRQRELASDGRRSRT